MKTVLICAMSLDGLIGRENSCDRSWASKEDLRFFRRETLRIGVMVMGCTTYCGLGRPLPDRLNIVMTRTPESRTSIPGLLKFTDRPPAEILADLAERGFDEVAIVGGGEINAAFLNAGLVDELWITVAPKILGSGTGLFGHHAVETDLELLSCEMLNGNVILLRYKVC